MSESASGHELIDAGDGRRLDRFGERLVDRPLPIAAGPRRAPGAWATADLRFDRNHGWTGPSAPAEPWIVDLAGLRFELRPTETGQVGLFPEQQATWAWVADQVRRSPRARVINLYAYTGGATLAAAGAGAEVVHLDASRPAVAWARRNATLSGLAERPIRWLVDDASAFLRREARRGRRYDGLILDPPSYGHGPRGGAWRLEEQLEDLLADAARVAAPGAFVTVSHHTPAIGDDRLTEALERCFGRPAATVETGALELPARSGLRLELGRWARLAGAR